MIFDTHAHYDEEAFDSDRDSLINSLSQNNVEAVVNVAANLQGCRNTLKLIDKYRNFYGALGVHPSDVSELTQDDIQWIRKEAVARSVRNGGKIVAIGEIGLEYHYGGPEKEIQEKWFVSQLELAKEINLPVIIHSREACKDTYDILEAYNGKISGIIHCYSYSVETAREYEKMGYYFGIGGVLTFKNAKKLVETVEYLPIERIVLETDAPYLAPTPFRGERNDSTMLKYVVKKISELKNISEEEVIDITTKNAKKVYGIE